MQKSKAIVAAFAFLDMLYKPIRINEDVTQTSGDCPFGGRVGAAQVNCSPARVFLIGTGERNSGAGLS